MIVKWIYTEPEELLVIRRNKGDSFEIDDNVGKQLIAQGKAQKTAQDAVKNDFSVGKSKGKPK